MTICKECWHSFTSNLMSTGYLLPEGEFIAMKKLNNKPAKDYLSDFKESVTGSKMIMAIKYDELSDEDFFFFKKNKSKFIFFGQRKEYIKNGFSIIEWA